MDEITLAPPAFQVSAFLSALRQQGCTLGEPFHYFVAVGSTNDEARRAAAAGAVSGSTFLADHQTAGRGRHGRQWLGEPNTQLLASVLWRPSRGAAASTATLAVGAALHRALSPLLPPGKSLELKWPNDIESGRRKLAGVLLESGETREYGSYVVIGLGINVYRAPTLTQPHPPVSLAELGNVASREWILTQCLREVATQLAVLESSGNAPIVEYVNRHHALTGETVIVGETTGQVLRVAEDGALVLSTPRGEVLVTAGTVERF